MTVLSYAYTDFCISVDPFIFPTFTTTSILIPKHSVYAIRQRFISVVGAA